MKILITGSKGQLGQTLEDVLSENDLILVDRDELDITDKSTVERFVDAEKPEAIINAAAYTAVDKAEEEAELAKNINVDGAKNLAEAAKKVGAAFFHISTDFVFDGKKDLPYTENDKPKPLSVYGKTKYDGEKAVQKIGGRYYILRTAWLYSPYGKNFVKTIMKLGQEKDELKVVADQIGCPTYSYDLADTIKQFVSRQSSVVSSKEKSDQLPAAGGRPPYGLYHFAGDGFCSWFEFATQIIKLSGGKAKVFKTTAEEYGSPAARPAYSVLDCSKIKLLGIKTVPWQESLKKCLKILKNNPC